jgi:hypothetical protein
MLINISKQAKQCAHARIVGRQYFAKYLTAKDGKRLKETVELWLRLEIPKRLWNGEALEAGARGS